MSNLQVLLQHVWSQVRPFVSQIVVASVKEQTQLQNVSFGTTGHTLTTSYCFEPVVMILRVYALYLGNKYILVFLLVVLSGQVIVSGWAVHDGMREYILTAFTRILNLPKAYRNHLGSQVFDIYCNWLSIF